MTNKEAIKQIECAIITGNINDVQCGALKKAIEALKNPAVPGHWIEETRDEGKGWYFATYFSCSNCDDSFGRKSKYCPNCGAKMDEENE